MDFHGESHARDDLKQHPGAADPWQIRRDEAHLFYLPPEVVVVDISTISPTYHSS